MIRTILSFSLSMLAIVTSSAQMTLSQYRAEVVAYSHQLSSAEAAMDGAEAALRISRKAFMPSLAVGGDIDVAIRSREGRQWGWSQSLDIEQPLYSGGALRADLRSAEAVVEVNKSLLDRSHLNVRYQAESAYWQLSRAEIYRNAVADYLTIVTKLRTIVARRFDEGYTSKSDLLQVESRYSDAEYQLSAAEQEYELALHDFNTLRGVELSERVVLQNSILDSVIMPQRADSEILTSHPDYRVSLSEREVARWAIRSSRARFMPSIALRAYGLVAPRQPHISGGGVVADGGAMLSISAPIFHFRELRDVVRRAESNYTRAAIEVEDVADRLRLEESNCWTNMLTTRSRVDATRRSLRLAEENLTISTYAYGEGSVTILDVLQAQLSWLQLYSNAIAAHYDYAIAIAAYRAITGVEW